MRRLVFLFVLVAIIPLKSEAQSDSLLTRILTDTTSLLGRIHMDSTRPSPVKPPVGSIRLASSTAGFMFGMVVGGFIGHMTSGSGCSGDCHESKGDGLLKGAAVAGAVGAGFGAAFLDLRSICPVNRRIVQALVGSGIGAYVAFKAAGGIDDRGRSAFFIPIGAIGGAMGTLGSCWRSR